MFIFSMFYYQTQYLKVRSKVIKTCITTGRAPHWKGTGEAPRALGMPCIVVCVEVTDLATPDVHTLLHLNSTSRQ